MCSIGSGPKADGAGDRGVRSVVGDEVWEMQHRGICHRDGVNLAWFTMRSRRLPLESPLSKHTSIQYASADSSLDGEFVYVLEACICSAVPMIPFNIQSPTREFLRPAHASSAGYVVPGHVPRFPDHICSLGGPRVLLGCPVAASCPSPSSITSSITLIPHPPQV